MHRNFIPALTLVIALGMLLTGVANAAATYTHGPSNITFEIPPGMDKITDEAELVVWMGDKHNDVFWSFNLTARPVKAGDIKFHYNEQLLQNDLDKKNNILVSTKDMTVPGAEKAMLIEKSLKGKYKEHRWELAMFTAKYNYQLIFNVDEASAKKFEPIMMKVIKSVKIGK